MCCSHAARVGIKPAGALDPLEPGLERSSKKQLPAPFPEQRTHARTLAAGGATSVSSTNEKRGACKIEHGHYTENIPGKLPYHLSFD